MDEPTRRRLLTATGSALAAGGLSSLSGCAWIPGSGGGSGTVPDAGAPTYRQWIPDHTSDDEDGYDGFIYWYFDHGRLRSLADRDLLPGGINTHLWIKTWLDHFGVDYDRIRATLLHFTGAVHLVAGDFSRQEVVDGLDDTGYADAGSHREYRLFTRSDDPRVIAATDGIVIQSEDGEITTDEVSRYIDGIADTAEQLHEVDDPFAATTDEAGSYPITYVGTAFSSSALLSVQSLTFDETRTFSRVVSAFQSADDVTVAPAERKAERLLNVSVSLPESGSDGTKRFDPVDSETKGRIATATYAMRTEAAEEWDESPENYPLATFGAEYDSDAGTVTVRHEAGETVPADLLTTTVDPGPTGSTRETDAQFSGTVTPGTSITVEADPHDRIRVVWENPDRTLSTSMISFEVPSRSGS